MPDKHHCRDEIMRKIKVEEGTDEVKIFSASTILKHEPDDDVDVDGIEDRLSPLVEEPVSSIRPQHQPMPSLSITIDQSDQTRFVQ